MFLDYIFFSLIFFYIIFLFYSNPSNLFSMLILSEIFWIVLYILTILGALFFNNIQLLSLALFFLMFSAVEISIGLSLLILLKENNNFFKTSINFFSNFNIMSFNSNIKSYF